MKVTVRHQTTPPLLELSLIALSLLLIASGVGWVFYARQQYQHTFYPEVYIDSLLITGKSPAEVEQLLLTRNQHSLQKTVAIQSEKVSISSSAAEIGLVKEYKKSIDQAFSIGHNQSASESILRLLNKRPAKAEFTTSITVDEGKLNILIELLKKEVDALPVEPSATLAVSGKASSLKVNPGKNGQVIDKTTAQTSILKALNQGESTIVLNTIPIPSKLTAEQETASAQRATKLVGKKITFKADQIIESVGDQKLISLLKLPEGISDNEVSQLTETWNKELNRPPRNTVFEYDAKTLEVKAFTPPQNGLTVQADDLKKLLTSTLVNLEGNSESQIDVLIPVKETPPQITLASTNDLGINEQIGFGDSQYFHSIPGRIHNVNLTATRINNTIVKAGAEFSFNESLGEVSAKTGFAPAYVIKNGRTELGDGGGVCQVSTTLFRALLSSGLKVTKRIPHSYRVSYYELNSKPGIDATVYAGEVDLRFINDSGHDILIHTENNPKALYLTVKIFGTSDGRTTQMIDHKAWGSVAAPPASYQNDPSLPKGKTKQVDFAAGGIKSSFVNVIKDKDGKTIREDTYYSNYKPWRAVFLVGSG